MKNLKSFVLFGMLFALVLAAARAKKATTLLFIEPVPKYSFGKESQQILTSPEISDYLCRDNIRRDTGDLECVVELLPGNFSENRYFKIVIQYLALPAVFLLCHRLNNQGHAVF